MAAQQGGDIYTADCPPGGPTPAPPSGKCTCAAGTTLTKQWIGPNGLNCTCTPIPGYNPPPGHPTPKPVTVAPVQSGSSTVGALALLAGAGIALYEFNRRGHATRPVPIQSRA